MEKAEVNALLSRQGCLFIYRRVLMQLVGNKGGLDGKMMVVLWFRIEVSAWDRRRTMTIFQKDLADRPIDVRVPVRIIAEISPERRPMSRACAIWQSALGK